MNQLQPSFPQGVQWFAPYDTSDFVRISIDEVIKTLAEAMVLVFLVMLLFPAEPARDADPDPGDPGRAAGHVPRA